MIDRRATRGPESAGSGSGSRDMDFCDKSQGNELSPELRIKNSQLNHPDIEKKGISN